MKDQNQKLPIGIAIVGLSLLAIVMAGSLPADDGHTTMPLLALLAMCEFGFIISLAGIFLGYKGIRKNATSSLHLVILATCSVLTILFALQGLKLWPG